MFSGMVYIYLYFAAYKPELNGWRPQIAQYEKVNKWLGVGTPLFTPTGDFRFVTTTEYVLTLDDPATARAFAFSLCKDQVDMSQAIQRNLGYTFGAFIHGAPDRNYETDGKMPTYIDTPPEYAETIDI